MFSQLFTIIHLYRLKTYFISWDMILKLKSFIQIGTFIFHEKFLTTRVPVNFLDETRYSNWIYHLDTPLWRYNTRKYSLGELILLSKEHALLYIHVPDKFQSVWMTKFFRMSVFYRSSIESTTSIGSRVTNIGRGWYDVTNPSRGVAETGMWHRITRYRYLSLWIRY